MYDAARISMCLAAALLCSGCDDGDANNSTGTGPAEVGDEGDTGDGDAEAGDGDAEAGDGDGDPNAAPVCDVPSPYQGGWDIGCCQADIVPSAWSPGGVSQGTVLPDWTFTDQYGDAVRIYDFCHNAIYFDYAAMWCGACQAHAPELATLFNTYDDRGLMTLTYMSESADGGPATQADVIAWSDMYSQNGLVVFSGLQDVWYPFGVDQGGGSFGIALPGTMLVGPNAKIAKLGVPSTLEVELVIPGE